MLTEGEVEGRIRAESDSVALEWLRRRPFKKRVEQDIPASGIDEKKCFESDIDSLLRTINSVKSLSGPSSGADSGLEGEESEPLERWSYLTNLVKSLWKSLKGKERDTILKLSPGEYLTVGAYEKLTEHFAAIWMKNDRASYFGLEGLLLLLELSLSQVEDNYQLFVALIEGLRENRLKFLGESVPFMWESAVTYGTDYTDSLLMYLSLYLVKTGENILAEFVISSPHFCGYYLCVNEKKFEERYSYIKQYEKILFGKRDRTQRRIIVTPHHLSFMHFPERRIIVSNAPPVKLRRRNIRAKVKFECEAAAGGLVSGLKPSLEKEDIWVSYLDPDIIGLRDEEAADRIKKSPIVPSEYKRCTSFPKLNLLDSTASDSTDVADRLWEQTEHDMLSLQRQLTTFAKENFTVNPMVILKSDHKGFYNGISNGLFWPAFHNLHQFIIQDYTGEMGPEKLEEDWDRYIKVNHHFAVYTARNSRPQDFLWIHDYHLFLVGLFCRSLHPSLHTGFFLHIPFLLSDEFMSSFREQGEAVLRGLLAFNRVGFQTQRDCQRFIELVKKHLPSAKIAVQPHTERMYTAEFGSCRTDFGAFPISIKCDKLIEISELPETQEKAKSLKSRILQGRTGKLFFSVERFDYSKGIDSRLLGVQRYLRKYPERAGKDVFYQIAASSRSDVSSYKEYQDSILRLSEEINEEFADEACPERRVVYLDTENHPHEELVTYFQAADVMVVTPVADGMNLVIKEAAICNPGAVLVLSKGAGAENQFENAGLRDSYLRIEDIKDSEEFAEVLLQAAVGMSSATTDIHGSNLSNYIKEHNIDLWLKSYFDPTWSHGVIKEQDVKTINSFETIMKEVRDVRRKVVDKILSDLPINEGYVVSFRNALSSLEREMDGYKKDLRTSTDLRSPSIVFSLKDEISGIRKDIMFLRHFKDNTVYAEVGKLIEELSLYHPIDRATFMAELSSLEHLLDRLIGGIHILITDWDGTMKNYGSNYATCMQPAYTAVILARFAHRYTTYSAVLTAGPLRDPGILDLTCVPTEDNWLTFGGSWGREWLLNGERVMDETSFTDEARKALDCLAEKIRASLSDQDGPFSHFQFVGSGFQRKVDRITLGIQNVSGDISQEVQGNYLGMVKELVEELDPNNEYFLIKEERLDVEICLQATGDSLAWDKAKGLELLVKHLKADISEGKILICGDTTSDLPMVEFARKKNPNTFAVFVNPNEEVKERLGSLLEPEYFNLVSCPEVLHAAMARVLLRPILIY